MTTCRAACPRLRGRMGRHTEKATELIIMIRPHVISTPADNERISQDLLKELMIHPSAPEAKGTLDTFKRSDLDEPVKR